MAFFVELFPYGTDGLAGEREMIPCVCVVGIDTQRRLIVDDRLAPDRRPPRQPSPQRQTRTAPPAAAVRSHVSADTLLIDSGFVSAAAVTAVELATPGLTILAALQREPHGRTVAQLEKHSDPPGPATGRTLC